MKNIQEQIIIWQIILQLLLIWVLLGLSCTSSTGISDYKLLNVEEYIGLSYRHFQIVSVLVICAIAPYTIQLAWNKYVCTLPNINPMTWSHGFAVLLVLEILNVYYN